MKPFLDISFQSPGTILDSGVILRLDHDLQDPKLHKELDLDDSLAGKLSNCTSKKLI
jgi:hypothetical protein